MREREREREREKERERERERKREKEKKRGGSDRTESGLTLPRSNSSLRTTTDHLLAHSLAPSTAAGLHSANGGNGGMGGEEEGRCGEREAKGRGVS